MSCTAESTKRPSPGVELQLSESVSMEICQVQQSGAVLTPLASPADASRFAAIKHWRAASLSSRRCAEAHLEKRSGEADSATTNHQNREQVQPQPLCIHIRQEAE